MARVKRAVNAQKKRRVVLERASGYRGQRSRLYRKAKEQLLHSATYSYRDRRARKGDFRRLWIQRINAAARLHDMTYNRLIQGLKAAGVEVDRKNLAELAVSDDAAFAVLVEVARKALPVAGASRRRRDRCLSGVSPEVVGSRSELTDVRSPRIKAAKRLLKRSFREQDHAFLAEGPQAVREALAYAASTRRERQRAFANSSSRLTPGRGIPS